MTAAPRLVLAAHQPVYLPGAILFNKIALSSAVVFLSDAQFVRSSWHHRNRIRVGADVVWLSIPVRRSDDHGFQRICDAQPSGREWAEKHLNTIYHAYHKRPFFADYFGRLRSALEPPCSDLSDLNIRTTRALMDMLGIDVPVHDSRDLAVGGQKTARLAGLCRSVGADAYVSNVGAAAYFDEELMRDQGIAHFWQAFEPPIYEQGAPFVPHLSVIDLLFNAGPDAAEIVRRAGRLSRTLPVTEATTDAPAEEP